MGRICRLKSMAGFAGDLGRSGGASALRRVMPPRMPSAPAARRRARLARVDAIIAEPSWRGRAARVRYHYAVRIPCGGPDATLFRACRVGAEAPLDKPEVCCDPQSVLW